MSSYWKKKFDESKKFVKDHQIVIACTATAVTTFVVTKAVTNASEEFYKGMYNGVINSEKMSDLEHLTLLEFIDFKDLTHEFEKFNRQMNDV